MCHKLTHCAASFISVVRLVFNLASPGQQCLLNQQGLGSAHSAGSAVRNTEDKSVASRSGPGKLDPGGRLDYFPPSSPPLLAKVTAASFSSCSRSTLNEIGICPNILRDRPGIRPPSCRGRWLRATACHVPRGTGTTANLRPQVCVSSPHSPTSSCSRGQVSPELTVLQKTNFTHLCGGVCVAAVGNFRVGTFAKLVSTPGLPLSRSTIVGEDCQNWGRPSKGRAAELPPFALSCTREASIMIQSFGELVQVPARAHPSSISLQLRPIHALFVLPSPCFDVQYGNIDRDIRPRMIVLFVLHRPQDPAFYPLSLCPVATGKGSTPSRYACGITGSALHPRASFAALI